MISKLRKNKLLINNSQRFWKYKLISWNQKQNISLILNLYSKSYFKIYFRTFWCVNQPFGPNSDQKHQILIKRKEILFCKSLIWDYFSVNTKFYELFKKISTDFEPKAVITNWMDFWINFLVFSEKQLFWNSIKTLILLKL